MARKTKKRQPAETGPRNTAPTLFGKIEAARGAFSPNDRRIADYLFTAYPNSAWETVENVAAGVDVSKAAVMRFSTRLGYDGYADLQRELQRDLSELFSSPLRLLQQRGPTHGEDPTDIAFKSVLENLNLTRQRTPNVQIEDAATRIAKCKGRIFVVGFRKSFGHAYYIRHMLSLILPNTALLGPDESTLPDTLIDVSKHDVVLAITVRRYARASIKALEHCRRQGAQIVVVSDSLVGPAAEYADLLIVGLTDGVSFSDSAVSIIFQLECIMNAVAGRTKTAASKRLQQIETLGRQFDVFSGVAPQRVDRDIESNDDG